MRKIYLAAGRLVSPLFVVALRLYTRATGIARVRVLVINERGEVLLVRGVISDGKWSLPGGGVERGESLVAAARRELHEETGIDAKEQDFTFLETLEKHDTGVSYTAPLFLLRTKRSALPKRPANKWEIAHIGWFKRNDLPEPISRLTLVVLSKHKVVS